MNWTEMCLGRQTFLKVFALVLTFQTDTTFLQHFTHFRAVSFCCNISIGIQFDYSFCKLSQYLRGS